MADLFDNQINQIAGIVKEVGQGGAGGVEIQVDPSYASNVNGRLLPYKNFPRTMRPALQAVADYVTQTMIPRTFNEEGPGWRKLSRRTQAERAAEGYNPTHPILIRSRDLFKEVTTRAHPKHIEIVKTGRNARVIIGGSSEKFIRNQAGNWMLHIPPRPMIPGTGNIPIPDKDRQQITRILKQGINEAIRERQQ